MCKQSNNLWMCSLFRISLFSGLNTTVKKFSFALHGVHPDCEKFCIKNGIGRLKFSHTTGTATLYQPLDCSFPVSIPFHSISHGGLIKKQTARHFNNRAVCTFWVVVSKKLIYPTSKVSKTEISAPPANTGQP